MTFTTQAVDLTMLELHKHIRQFQLRNPAVADAAVLIEMAIGERWPGLLVADVLFQAEQNWLAQERRDTARDAARNLDEWIDTQVQGDLFDDLPVSVPRWVILDGERDPVEYWKCSPLDLLEYLSARAAALLAEAEALRAAMQDKEKQVARVRREIEHTRAVIDRAKANGLDPAALHYAKAR
jgi:hypothetical protein